MTLSSFLSCLSTFEFVKGDTETELLPVVVVYTGDDVQADCLGDVEGGGEPVCCRLVVALVTIPPSLEDVGCEGIDLVTVEILLFVVVESRCLVYLNGFLKGAMPQTILLSFVTWWFFNK